MSRSSSSRPTLVRRPPGRPAYGDESGLGGVSAISGSFSANSCDVSPDRGARLAGYGYDSACDGLGRAAARSDLSRPGDHGLRLAAENRCPPVRRRHDPACCSRCLRGGDLGPSPVRPECRRAPARLARTVAGRRLDVELGAVRPAVGGIYTAGSPDRGRRRRILRRHRHRIRHKRDSRGNFRRIHWRDPAATGIVLFHYHRA